MKSKLKRVQSYQLVDDGTPVSTPKAGTPDSGSTGDTSSIRSVRSARITSTPFLSPTADNRPSNTAEAPIRRSRSRAETRDSVGSSSRGSHRWSMGTSSVASTATQLPQEDAVGDIAIVLHLQQVNNREVFGGQHGAASSLRHNVTVINTPVDLRECVLFSLAVPSAMAGLTRASILEQLKYCIAVAQLVKQHPVEFQRL